MTDKLTTEDVLRKLNAELEAQVLEMEGDLDSALTKLNIARGQASERAKRIRELSRDKEHWRKKCVDLEEQIESDDVDFIRVIHAREVEQLREILDACEAANFRHLARIDNLEQLCRDLWEFSNVTGSGGAEKAFKERMEQLGLLDGEQNG